MIVFQTAPETGPFFSKMMRAAHMMRACGA
jgi:hypothetical protein